MSDTKLLIFDTHPIQYRSPVFRELAKLIPQLEVCYFSESFEGDQWWLHEKSTAKSQNWQVSLTEGFSSRVISPSFSSLRRTLKDKKPDAILFYGYFLPQHWMLWCLANLYRIPLIFIGETQLRKSTSLRQKLKDLLLPLFFKGVDQVVSIGNQSKEFYQHYGVANSKITEAKYCVDNAFFSHAAEGAKPKTSPFTILFVGRLFKRKRPNDLIALMEKLKGLPVEALVVGTGPLENELKERAKHLPQIKFLGFKSQPEVREIYPQCDLLFVPSEYETWGLVINEAMCAKVPALVTSTCGAANDLVIPNETGFVFSVGDIQMAKEKIEKCLTDSSFFQKLKENAYQRVTHSYQPIQFANKIYEAFSMSRGQIESNTRSRFVIGS